MRLVDFMTGVVIGMTMVAFWRHMLVTAVIGMLLVILFQLVIIPSIPRRPD